MIELVTGATPNGATPAIMLEEAGPPYTVRLIDSAVGAQFSPAFPAISPSNKIPALIDCDATDAATSFLSWAPSSSTLQKGAGRSLLAAAASATKRFGGSVGPHRAADQRSAGS